MHHALHWLSGPEWIELAVAIGTIGLALAAFVQLIGDKWSKPKLKLLTEPEPHVNTRLEASPPRVPWVRLLVSNKRRRRAAHGSRVLLVGFRSVLHDTPPTSLGQPELGWPSTELAQGAGAVIFAGTARPLDFGALGIGPPGEFAGPANHMGAADELPSGYQWWFRFTLAMHSRNLFVGREFLPPLGKGYVARVIVGADDARAVIYDVTFDWDGHAKTPGQALASFKIAAKRVPRP